MSQKLQNLLEVLYDFRQFIIFIILLVIATIFTVTHYLTGSEYDDLMKNVTVALFAIHGVQHLTDLGKNFIEAKFGKKGNGTNVQQSPN